MESGKTSRRHFIRTAAGSVAGVGLGLPRARAYGRERLDPTDDWYAVQQAFRVDRSLVHLNNGGVCPAPASVMEALGACQDASNRRPFYAHRAEVSPQLEAVRARLAGSLGCHPEEIAITRNTSEGMEICQMGLGLQAGDEVVTTAHDYPRMLAAWDQRVRRDGVVVRRVPVPVPLSDPQALVDSIAATISPRTRVVMCCHMVDLTGQILPVREIVRVAHERDVPVLVDGAQTFGHFPFSVSQDLACDFFATSLHKWLMGPEGTGMLYVRRDRIADIWPLMPDSTSAGPDDIRKLEDVGTVSPAPALAVGAALAFHAGVGETAKAARLRDLRDYWMNTLLPHSRVQVLTDTRHAGSLTTIHVDGIDPLALRNHLWNVHRIRVRPISRENVQGIRVSPSIYNTLPELDYFTSVMTGILDNGLPQA